MKKMKVFITSVLLSSALSITALAGEWKQDDIGWWYQNDDGSYTTDTWQNIEGKNYLFDANGYMRTGWIHTVSGKWYYLNPTGEMRYDDLTENGITYHFDSNGYCTNPNNESGFDSDYQSILNEEQLEAQKRLLDQGTSTGNAYEENIVYEHDAAPQPIKNRFPLADMQF